uniref:Trafficking protein particle complex subunit 8 n=1 Tax=Petromyzon marinus TaxID=7757 RepID=A0AAJ7TZI3_PETMA|nr:trafficking protein particle complex subunit 8 [Petromyzon marinus]
MAQCAQGASEFLQDVFVPRIATLCSPDAEAVTRKNNLSFPELLRPFCRLTSEVHLRDPNNQLHAMRGLRVSVSRLETRAPAPTAARKMLSDVVSASHAADGPVGNLLSAGDYDLNISATTPWYEAYRESFMQVLPVSDHEFLRHYLACMLVVSSSHADPMDMFGRLSQDQHRVQHSGDYAQPKWLSPNTLKYYVLVHDMATGDERRAESVYESMKQLYGSQACHLLKINSRQPSRDGEEQIPDPWSQYLNRCTSLHYARLLDGGGTTVFSFTEGEDEVMVAALTADHDGAGQGCDLQAHPLQQPPPSSSTQADEAGWAPAPADVGNSQPHPADPRSALGVGGPPPLPTAAVGGCGGGGSGGGGGGPQTAGPRGLCLTLADHERIRQFVHEFTVQGLLPHVERSIRQLNDQLVSRKGLSRSLFSATKKWFGGAKTPERAVAESKNTTGLLYTAEAPELQVRKMADLCFLVQLYDLAYNCYHTAKKDFEGEQAWLYMAGALEMAALSVFLQPSAQRQYPAHYMEKAIQTYKDNCRNGALAERCTMLAVEILKSKGTFSDAASMLIRLISEDSDLRSALFLEQAAHCFINMRVPLARKFAFHMILAGHRYSKASQRKHSLRCYSQALQVYKGKGWSLAEDHINLTIGRQSFTLRQLDNSVSAFRHILINESRQSPIQQAAFLREYLYVYKHVSGAGPEDPLPQLPLPYVDSAATRLFLGHDHKPAQGEMQAATHISLDQEHDREAAVQWRELEEVLVSAAVAARGGGSGGGPTSAASSSALAPYQQCLSAHTDNTRPPVAVLHEPITVEVCFRNPLKIPLVLTDLALLWKFQARDFLSPAPADTSPSAVTNEKMPAGSDLIKTEVNPEFVLQSEETKAARLRLLPKQTGELHILGLVYSLSTLPSAAVDPEDPFSAVKVPGNGMVVRGRQDLEVQGPRLNGTLAEKTTVQYGPDRRLDPLVTPPMPLLQVFFINFPSALLCGEIQKTHAEFANVGPRALLSLRVASRNPEFFTFGDGATAAGATAAGTYATRPRPAQPCVTPVPRQPAPAPPTQPRGRPLAATASHGIVEVPLPHGRLEPGATLRLPMWIRGPEEEGVHEVNFIFYYEGAERHPKLSHRVLRHTAVVCTARSLRLTAKAARSHRVQRDAHSLLLQLNIENLNQVESSVREFQVSQVSSVSGEWLLSPCLAPPAGTGITLGPREKMKLCFKATRCKPGSCEDTGKLMYTDVTFADEQILSWATPCSDFFARSRRSGDEPGAAAALAAAAAAPAWAPADSPAELHRQQQQEVVVKSSRAEISLTLLWKAVVVEDKRQTIVEGQHHVRLEDIGTEVTSPPLQQLVTELPPLRFVPEEPVVTPATGPNPDALSRMVKCSLQYAQRVTHNFTANRLCVLPINLLLYNCCPASVEVAVDCRGRSSIAPDGSARPDVQSGFSWCGPTQRRLSLGALSTHRLRLAAAFTRPGVYNLGTAHVSARLRGDADAVASSAAAQLPPTATAAGVGGNAGGSQQLLVRQHLPAPAFMIVEQGTEEAVE